MTIIVLLILAGISIQMLTGDNGILQRAGEAKITMDEQQEAEKIQLSYMAEKTNQLGKAVQANGLQEEIEKYGEAEVFDNGDGTFYVIYKDSGNCYLVDKNGNATKSDKSEVISGVFAIIYSDGTMVFNTTGNTVEGKTVLYQTGDISQTKFEETDDILWRDYLAKIKNITFEEEIKPMYTKRWFQSFKNLTQITGIQKLNTKNVKDMCTMFAGCSNLTTLDVSNFDTKNVTNMRNMFNGCSKLASINVSNFDTKNVTNMRAMFCSCKNLTSINVSNFDTRNVTNMNGMFEWCSQLTELNLNNFDTRNVTEMGVMFSNCSKMISLNVSNFDTRNVTDMHWMFNRCLKLTSLDVSNFNTSNVTDMSYMFNQCSNLTSLNVSNFNTSNVINMAFMFYNCYGLTSLDVSSFDTSNVTDMSYMFGCGLTDASSQLQEIKGLENFDTSKVTTMKAMFIHQIKLKKLNLSGFNTSNVENMRGMFEALNVEEIYVSSKWNTSKVTDSTEMFGGKTSVGSNGKTFTYAGVNEPLKLTGGNGTKWDPEHIDKEYARIDTAVYDEAGNYVSGDKGYFSVLPEE